MKMRLALPVASLLMIAAASAASAVDTLIPGKVSTVKTASLTKFVAKNTSSFPLPVPGSGNDPTIVGGSVTFFDTGFAGAGTINLTLPAAGWTGLGNPAGSLGYKFRGAVVGSACTSVLLKGRTIKVICKGASVTLAPPFAADEAVQITTGAQRYCAQLGGTTKKNAPGSFKRKDAPAPALCVTAPGVPTNTPTFTPSNTPTRTPTRTPTGTPTNTLVGGPTNTPTNTPTRTPTGTPTNTPGGGSCPITAGRYVMTGTAGGTLATATVAAFPFPAGGTITQEVGAGDANCVHQTVIPFPGGFTAPVFCIPGVMFSVRVEQTGCGVGRIDSNGGSDYTVTERGDTDDQSPTCNLPHPNCVNGQPSAPVAGKVDSNVRVQITVGNGAADTCPSGGVANVMTAIPVYTQTWIEFSSGFSCPANDGTYNAPTDTLVTQFPQILDFTTDTATSSWEDLDGSGCWIVGSGSPNMTTKGFSGAGKCATLVGPTRTVTTVATGTVGSAGGPYYDLSFINTIPNNITGPTANTGATCPSPPVINFTGTATRCLSGG